jgi:hypothetical protein
MSIRNYAAFAALTLTMLLGCSTPAPEEVNVERAPQPVAQLAPLQNAQALPPGTPEFGEEFRMPKSPEVITGRVCQLGTSCLALDSRPFEPCLVGTKRCRDKVREPIEVQTPKVPQDGVQEIGMPEAGVPAE